MSWSVLCPESPVKWGKETFSFHRWDCWIISNRRSLESIPWSLPVKGSNVALHYDLRLSLPPANLSAHLWCWREASCQSDVPVCKMVTSICCSGELVSHAAELTSLREHSWVQHVQNSHPPKRLLLKHSDLPSFPVNKKYRDRLELFQIISVSLECLPMFKSDKWVFIWPRKSV